MVEKAQPQLVTTALIERQQAASIKFSTNLVFAGFAWTLLVCCFLIFGPDDFWNIKTLSAGGFHEQLFAIGLSFIALFCLVVAPIAAMMALCDHWRPLTAHELKAFAELAFHHPQVDKHWQQNLGSFPCAGQSMRKPRKLPPSDRGAIGRISAGTLAVRS
jgi:hypothetical protein